MASYSVNEDAVAHASRLIDGHQYVLESVWSDAQPSADDENTFLESHSWDDYAAWHLGLTEGVPRRSPPLSARWHTDGRRDPCDNLGHQKSPLLGVDRKIVR